MSSSRSNQCLFVLSGEHPLLPLAELCAILEAEGYRYKVLKHSERIAILDVNPSGAIVVIKRAALVNSAQLLLFEAPMVEKQILQAMAEVDFHPWFRRGSRFGVKVTRVRREHPPVDVLSLQSELGSRIWQAMKGKVTVNLNTPDVLFLGLIYSDRFFFGVFLASRNRRGFYLRRSPRRPFFVPSAFHPKTARVMVNLSRATAGNIFLDPFCGTGGLLLEAAMVGCTPIGLDIDQQILSGCRRNLAHFDVSFLGICADAREPPIREKGIDAIATDPPYGRASSMKGEGVATLISTSLTQLADVLKQRRYLCFALPLRLYNNRIVDTKDFSILETHTMRIHRSLSRHIVVLQRR